MDREHSCESFDLLLQTMHEVLYQHASPLSLELGVVDGQVIQAFRTTDKNIARSIKNALRNVFPTCKLYRIPDDAFAPLNETSGHFSDVVLKNDLYSIRRWKQLLTQSDPLSTLLGALSVNQHSKCFGHLSITLEPIGSQRMKVHQRAFKNLQRDLFLRHDLVASCLNTQPGPSIALGESLLGPWHVWPATREMTNPGRLEPRAIMIAKQTTNQVPTSSAAHAFAPQSAFEYSLHQTARNLQAA